MSSSRLSVWDLKEVGTQESNGVFLVGFLVVMWTNIFYQSLKYLKSEDLGKGSLHISFKRNVCQKSCKIIQKDEISLWPSFHINHVKNWNFILILQTLKTLHEVLVERGERNFRVVCLLRKHRPPP